MSIWEKLTGMGKKSSKETKLTPDQMIRSLSVKRESLIKQRDALVADTERERHPDDSRLIESLNAQIAQVEDELKSSTL